jgi:hypothetical protein
MSSKLKKVLRQGKQTGKHYDLAKDAIKRINKIDFLIKAKDEKDYEHCLRTQLKSSRKLRPFLIDHIDKDPKVIMTRSDFFGFRHSPDITIGDDGTAIELKLIKSGQALRDMLGQALCYRTNYRFVILVFIAEDSENPFIALCKDKKCAEFKLLNALAKDFNIFSIVGPQPNRKNLAFY